jgi:hypothetical protein
MCLLVRVARQGLVVTLADLATVAGKPLSHFDLLVVVVGLVDLDP